MQPEAWEGFGMLHRAAAADGVLPGRVKELIALAIAVVKHCDGCIEYHAKAAAQRGASPEEVAEALSVALLMDGGPATVFGPRAFAAYQESVIRRGPDDGRASPRSAPDHECAVALGAVDQGERR
jgi:AhpD family alkylhydroperoxidase